MPAVNLAMLSAVQATGRVIEELAGALPVAAAVDAWAELARLAAVTASFRMGTRTTPMRRHTFVRDGRGGHPMLTPRWRHESRGAREGEKRR